MGPLFRGLGLPDMSQHGPGLQHPLLGARLELLLASLLRQRIAARHLPLAGLFLLSALARLPARGLDQWRYQRRRQQVEPLPAPVFIVGHWRSGTTHLHNLLGQSPAFGHISPIASGLPDELLTLGTWLRPWLERSLPTDREVDRVAVTPRSPQEDEIPLANQQALSVFHALYFPRRFQQQFQAGVFFEGVSERRIARRLRLMQQLYEKVALQQGQSRLLIKNLVYTAHVARLRAIWPQARFIHVIRNPYRVFASTVHYYRKLLPTLALQDWQSLDIEALVLEHYPRLLTRFDADSRHLPADHWLEVHYEDLVATPLPVLERIHRHLALPGWAQAAPRITEYLQSLGEYRVNTYALDAATRERVAQAWGPFIDRWGYAPP